MKDQPEKHEGSLQSLMDAVLNGDASTKQYRLLEERLIEDEQARDLWLEYANLQASLNRWFLVGELVESLEDDIVDWRGRTLDSIGPKPSRLRFVSLGVILATCLLAVVGFFQLPLLRSLLVTPIAEGLVIVQATGDIQVQASNGSIAAATSKQTIQPGETVISKSDEDRVAMRFADGTEIVLLGKSGLTIKEARHGGKQLYLKDGLLQADVAPQLAGAPLLIVTPQTHVRVLGTRFELLTDERAGTRLELDKGKVELVRRGEQPLKIEPNSIAIVPATGDPIRVSPRPDVIDTPRRETAFKGLKSIAYAENGTTLVAATSWQALYWHKDDRLEVVPFSARGRKGISLRQHANSFLVYNDHHDAQVKVWDTRSRESRSVFEDINQLRAQFRSSSERPPSWNPVTQIAVVSPQADWLAFQAGRELRLWKTEQERWGAFAINYDGKFISALASSPNGETLAIAVRRSRVDLVDVNTGELTMTWSLRHKVPFAMDFSADGKCLALGLAGQVAVHDVATGEVLGNFEQPGLPFVKVAISPDGRFVAASSLGDRVWVWDVSANAELPLLNVTGPIKDLAFAPNGERLAVLSGGGRLTIWGVAGHITDDQISKSETSSK